MTDLRYGKLKNYRDLFAKLQRDVATFAASQTDDALFNGMVTAWSLTDWIREDVDLSPDMDVELLPLTGRDSEGKSLPDRLSTTMQICKDITNGSKHAVIRRYTPQVKRVVHTDGSYGSGLYGFSSYGGGNNAYAIVVGDDVYDAQDVLEEAVAQFQQFFSKHKL
jgi:hypothetical protein